ncbi:MAG: ubiquinone/menaquinone biosynthesis methyltransferase [Gemmatimonadaceae bacterium]|nr:ubiquinone/menaquinone biosynthesis methyltransferase [Gemmatimonadaceae bacterium]
MVIEQHNDPLTRFRAQDLDAAMADARRKQGVVTPMFDVIAPRYDAFTRLFSFGMDAVWKRDLIEAVVSRSVGAHRALDVACGTGDLGFSLAAQVPSLHVVGVDPSAGMLALAAARATREHTERVTFHLGEFAALPADPASIDVLTAGYGFRNVPDLDAAVRECARVIKPGGTLGSLDFFLPPNAIWRALFLWYLRASGNIVGWWWHRTPAIYGYIARSIASFVTADEFTALLQQHGFTVVSTRRMLFGGTALHLAVRQGTS